MNASIIDIVIPMTVKNDKIVYNIDDEEVEEDHSLNHCALSHVHYLVSRTKSKAMTDDGINNGSNWRKHNFNVVLPRKLSAHTNSDLKLMLVSLKNTAIATSVHIHRIERELESRGCNLTILRR